MPAPDIVIGVVDNNGPGPVCGVCQLGPDADQIAKISRNLGYTYQGIADALNAGKRTLGVYHLSALRPITSKVCWHHLNGHRGRVSHVS